MASDGPGNGVASSTQQEASPAEQLMKKHAADESHRATIEDVVDEEDIAHPPPSAHLQGSAAGPSSDPPSEPKSESMSAKAAGKQKAKEEPITDQAPAKSGSIMIDTKSDEAFPSLGPGPKPRAAAAVSSAWGAKKPASVAKAAANGVNGHAAEPSTSSTTSSRASTPASGMLTPSSVAASATPQSHLSRGPTPQILSMPGRHTEGIQFAPSQLLPRNQLKKPVMDVLRDINKRSKATVEMRPGPGGMINFEGRGPTDAVRQALKDVAKELGSKQTVKVPIPASIRPHIIGRQGAVVQGISQRTGAKIQVPRPDESSMHAADDDDGATIDVTIEGDAVAAEMARREIEAIINDRTSTVNMRLKDIPAEFYPFIAGPHNSRVSALEEGRDLQIRVPQYHTWSAQPPPQAPSSDQRPSFAPQQGDHIQISGDRLAAQDARAEIERQIQELRQRITLSQIPVPRGQHQFIVGDRGSSLHDFLKETGCAIILPPESDDSEMVTITGPPENIELGVNKIIDMASSMQSSNVDISRQHMNAPMGAQAHARALTKYLLERQAVDQLERLHDSHIVIPSSEDAPMTWELYSRDGKNLFRARSDIMNIVNAHPPSRLTQMEVDPFFHQHIREQSAPQVLNDYGVHLIVPDEVEQTPQLLLVYEGLGDTGRDYELPKQRPSPAELAQFERGLREAQKHILDLISGRQEIIAKSITVPQKFHEKVGKFVRREHQNMARDEIPVHVLIGEPRGRRGKMAPHQNPIAAAALENEVTLRGPAESVEELASKILAFVEQEKQDEIERGYTITFDYPQKFANYLIGRKGENIKKYREEFDVDIQVNDGKVEVKGPKAKAEAAKARIIALGKKLEDEATHVLKIKPQYHRDMIGPKGGQVNRLQERYNVRVQFPRSAPAAFSSDDQSIGDTASEVGGARNGRSNQAPDEVIVRGPRKGADEARDELLSLLQWTIDNSHTATVSVAQNQIPSLIGQGGREMENMRMTTGATIDVPGVRDAVDHSGRAEIRLKGTKKQVEDARNLLEQRAKVFDENITRSIAVDKKYHKALIGGGGANIRNIVIQAGGPDDRRELARMVRFPRQESDENTVRVEGNKAIVDKIVAAIEEFVSERENQIVETMEIAPEKHRLLIGRGGETRRNLESQFNVSIDIPKQSTQGHARSIVKIAGKPTDVEKAKNHVLTLVKDQDGETVQVPRRVHHRISDNGQFFRRLRNDHKVMVDHGGQQPPPRPAPIHARSRMNGGALPLITDVPDSSEHFSWELLDLNDDNDDDGEIPWVLRGQSEDVAKARAMLEKALEQAQQQSSTGYLILPDPRTYRFVVGPGGSQINSLRRQTGCKINVPRDQAKGEAIEIEGQREGVEKAKDLILELVTNGGNGGSGGRRG